MLQKYKYTARTSSWCWVALFLVSGGFLLAEPTVGAGQTTGGNGIAGASPTAVAPISLSPTGMAGDQKQDAPIRIQEKKEPEPCYEEAPLVAVFMVKDEAHIIEKTLDPYVACGIKHFFVFDTGSIDETIHVTETYFKKNALEQVRIMQEPFVNFEVSRNRALELAHQNFPKALFLLMPDAEWYLRNGQELLEFCKLKAGETQIHSYGVRIMNAYTDFDTQRLIRNDGISHFVGCAHETIVPVFFDSRVPGTVYFELGSTPKGQEKSRKRWERDRDCLLETHEKDPLDTRTVFYLARTYDSLNDLENAHKYYQLRVSMHGGWAEENWVAVLGLAIATEKLASMNKGHTWAEAQDLYLQAYNMRPQRIEPLLRLAQHYWDNNINTPEKNLGAAFMFAKKALETDYPAKDVLFIEKHAYEYDRYEMMSKLAWYLHECKIGERATRHVLEQNENPQMLRNLALYLECNQGDAQ